MVGPGKPGSAGSRNRPVKVTWQQGASRLFNLVIGLLNAPSPRPTAWVVENIEGYSGQLKSRERVFHRDRESLRQLGIQLGHESREGQDYWLLRPEQVFLPDLDLSEAELQVLATATQWARQPVDSAMAGPTARAQLKLAGAGLSRVDDAAVVQPVPDMVELDPRSVDAIFRATQRGLRMTFWYYPAYLVEPEQRTLDPWAVAGIDGRLYVTGFDVDRGAQRTFRLARLSDVRAEAQFVEHPAPTDPATGQPVPAGELIRRGLAGHQTKVTASVLFTGEGAIELQDMARELRDTPDGRVGTVGPVDRDWLVQTAASYAPDAVLLEPQELVVEVLDLLQRAQQLGTQEQISTTQATDADAATLDGGSAVAEQEPEITEADAPDQAMDEVEPADVQAPPVNLVAQQFAQTLSVLAWFQAHPRGSFMRASRDLGLSVAQIQHELKQLSMCGLPGYYPGSLVEIAMDRTTAEAQFTAGLDGPVRLSTVEAGALLLNLEAVRDAVPAEQREAVDSVTEKLRGLLEGKQGAANQPSTGTDAGASQVGVITPEHQETAAQPQPNAPENTVESTLELLRTALAERRVVDCEYLTLSRDQRSSRRLVPDAIRMIEGNAYLLARSLDDMGVVDETPKNFRVSRMSEVTLGEEASAPARLSSEVDATDPFDFGAAADWAHFRLSDSALWMLEYFPLWPDADAQDGYGSEADGAESTSAATRTDARSTAVTMPDTGAWLERFLIAHAGQVAELSTPGLAGRVARRAETGLGVYRDRFPDVS
ncbi:MAG TPA: WYL domain-containing protein [Candidatus Corynebacterium intestinavium]|uniref:WYL domain-containing protein n=1 Tax=Candidatus Corynebacterium intestinavium TaxID=2838531 RepID=A0A9D2ZQ92_9CORY|nr:WYL domain-containing protein [Candidatus Corynebacterium intestinavium]